jgi:hypothetical protein
MRHTWTRVVTVVAFAWLFASLGSAATAPLPPHATYSGLTCLEWLATWWQACLATL